MLASPLQTWAPQLSTLTSAPSGSKPTGWKHHAPKQQELVVGSLGSAVAKAATSPREYGDMVDGFIQASLPHPIPPFRDTEGVEEEI